MRKLRKKVQFRAAAEKVMRARAKAKASAKASGVAEPPEAVPMAIEAAPEPALKANEAAPEPAPEAAHEAAPEAAPEADAWPLRGNKVAVGIEHLSHFLRLGEVGRCIGPSPGEPDEVMVKFEATSDLAGMSIPRALLVEVRQPMRQLKWWSTMSEILRAP